MMAGLDLKPVGAKAFARFLYASVPGAARIRFAIKDLAAQYVSKPEFGGLVPLRLGQGQIVDVGANRGQSVAAFRRLCPGSEVIAFEPDPRCAAQIRAQYDGEPKVVLYDCALGSAPRIFSIFIPRYGMWECDGMAATSREEATLWLRDRGRMFRFDERRLTVEERPVECKTLDSFALNPGLIKVHAQGAELDILRGASETLRRSGPALMCAFPTPAVIDFLQALGYRPYVYDLRAFTPGIAGEGVTFTWFLTGAHRQLI